MNMDFSDKLIQLRKQKGFSQEMLAELLDVSRQAVSKWEAGRAMPDISKLIAMADLFNVSLDELLRDKVPEKELAEGPMVVGPLVAAASLRREYKSKAKLFGIPLVHICFGGRYGPRGKARGIIAIGDLAFGVIAIGGLAAGVISFGGLAFGLLFALAGVSMGGFAVGGLAVGFYALGGLALGMWTFGGLSIAGQVAGGGLAISGQVAVGGEASAPLAFSKGASLGTFEAFRTQVLQRVPGTFNWFIRVLYTMMQ